MCVEPQKLSAIRHKRQLNSCSQSIACKRLVSTLGTYKVINWFSNGKLVFKWVNVYRYVAELALLNARVKGYGSKINHCRTVIDERERELEMAEGALDYNRENAEEVARDFENRDELESAELDNMRGGAV